MFDWMISMGCPLTEWCFMVAAKLGDIHTMNWLLVHDCILAGVMTFTYAVIGGSTKCIQWLHDHNCPCDETAFIVAVRSGNTEIMQLLFDLKCPWNSNVLEAAKGSRDVMEWLRDRRCPYNSSRMKDLVPDSVFKDLFILRFDVLSIRG